MDWSRFMYPPPPAEPPPSAVELPTLEPRHEPEAPARTRGLGLFHRLAVLWCRANGFDHSQRIRDDVDTIIERARSKEHEQR